MPDIIITGKARSGKTDFAIENFADNYDIHDDMPSVEHILRDSSRVRPDYGKNRVYITNEPIDIRIERRKFIIIKMPDYNG